MKTNKDPSPPLFVVGCDRSGTTLLWRMRLMLNKHPQLFVPPRSAFIPALSERAEVYGDFSQVHQRYFFIRDLQLAPATTQYFSFDIFCLSPETAEAALAAAAGRAGLRDEFDSHVQPRPERHAHVSGAADTPRLAVFGESDRQAELRILSVGLRNPWL
ncbi:MAG: sulfotransferase [Geitlerinemataceae cyanobacterium]